MLEERGVTVRFDQRAHGDASVDSDHLQQAVIDVLLNAVDASGRGGVVSVRMESTDDQINIAVSDTGPGLSAESQAQVSKGLCGGSGGTGLGLAVTKTVLEKMGATIGATGHFRRRKIYDSSTAREVTS